MLFEHLLAKRVRKLVRKHERRRSCEDGGVVAREGGKCLRGKCSRAIMIDHHVPRRLFSVSTGPVMVAFTLLMMVEVVVMIEVGEHGEGHSVSVVAQGRWSPTGDWRVTPWPDVIVLENGSTTQLISLEDFLRTQKAAEDAAASTTAAPTTQTSPDTATTKTTATTTTTSSSTDSLHPVERQTQEARGPGERHDDPDELVDKSQQQLQKNDQATNNTTAANSKSAKLAIEFTLPESEGRESAANATMAHHHDEPATTQQTTTTTTTTTTNHHHNHEERQQQQQHEHNHHEQQRHGHNHHGTPTNKTNVIPQHYQVRSLLNVTNDYPLAHSQIIFGYVWPITAAITIFTNMMIVFVLTQADMRTPTNVVLTAIAIADIIPIVVPVPWFVYLFAMGQEEKVLFPPIYCYIYQHSTRSMSEIFYALSTWLNLLLAIQDYLAACRPKLAAKYCQIRVVILEIVLLTLFAFLLNLPQLLKIVYKPVKFYYRGELTWGCKSHQAKWFKDLVGEYAALYDDIFTGIIVAFVDGGPAVVLITLTSILIRQLHRQRIKGHLLMEQARTASKRRRERHRQQEYEASARVMIFVLIAFLLVKIPFTTTFSLMIVQSRFGIRFVENLGDFQVALSLIDLLFVLSYPINFTIFCCCSKKFRHKCAQMLSHCNRSTKLTRDRMMSSFHSSLNSDSFLSRRFSSSFNHAAVGGGGGGGSGRSGRLHRDSSVSFILPEEEEEEDRGRVDGAPCKGKMKKRKKFSMPDLISKSSSMSSASTVAPKSQYSASIAGQSEVSCESLSPERIPAQQAGEPVGQNQRCEGVNHFFTREEQRLSQQHQQQRDNAAVAVAAAAVPSGQEFRRLVGEGSLCLECIMCYEKLRRSSISEQQAHEQTAPAADSAAPLESMLNQAPGSDDYHDARRRSSGQVSVGSSQFSWPPASLPPAPPQPRSLASLKEQLQQNGELLLHNLNGGVPQIITTTCESIDEHRSSTEEEAEEEEAAIIDGEVSSIEPNETAEGPLVAAGKQHHGHHLARQLRLSNESDLSRTTTASEMRTQDDGVSPRQGDEMNFGEVGQFLWEARRRLETTGAVNATTTSNSNNSPRHHHHPHPHRRHADGTRARQSVGTSSPYRSGDALPEQRARSRSGDYAFESSYAPTPRYLTRPHAVDARADVTNSAPAVIDAVGVGGVGVGGGVSELPRERRRSNEARGRHQQQQRQRQQHKAHSDSQTEMRLEERMTLSEQATKPTAGELHAMKKSHTRGDRLSLTSNVDSRQRSLSLSNSNLSTLPNATGMLADVLVTVLMVGKQEGEQGEGEEEEGQGKAGGSKGGGKLKKLRRKFGKGKQQQQQQQ